MFRGMLLIYHGVIVELLLIFVVKYRVVDNLVIFSRMIMDTASQKMLILFHTTRGSEPPSGKVETCLDILSS
jgi:hypothetical protein